MQLKHKNIVGFEGYGIDGVIETQAAPMKDVYFLVLEYISHQTLVDLVHEFKSLYPPLAKYFFLQIVETLIFMNSKRFSHRDIKMENLLLTSEYELKVSDFGFASFSKDLLD